MTVTKHADQRIRKRLGLKRKAVVTLAKKAFELGLEESDTNGKLLRIFKDRKDLGRCKYGFEPQVRLYNGNWWIFDKGILITIIQTDTEVDNLFH